MRQMDGQGDLGNEYAKMRLLQLTSQPDGEFLPCPAPPRHHHRPVEEPFRPVVEHIYESPDSVRRVPWPPAFNWIPPESQ